MHGRLLRSATSGQRRLLGGKAHTKRPTRTTPKIDRVKPAGSEIAVEARGKRSTTERATVSFRNTKGAEHQAPAPTHNDTQEPSPLYDGVEDGRGDANVDVECITAGPTPRSPGSDSSRHGDVGDRPRSAHVSSKASRRGVVEAAGDVAEEPQRNASSRSVSPCLAHQRGEAVCCPRTLGSVRARGKHSAAVHDMRTAH